MDEITAALLESLRWRVKATQRSVDYHESERAKAARTLETLCAVADRVEARGEPINARALLAATGDFAAYRDHLLQDIASMSGAKSAPDEVEALRIAFGLDESVPAVDAPIEGLNDATFLNSVQADLSDGISHGRWPRDRQAPPDASSQ